MLARQLKRLINDLERPSHRLDVWNLIRVFVRLGADPDRFVQLSTCCGLDCWLHLSRGLVSGDIQTACLPPSWA